MARPSLGYRNAADKKVPGVTTILKQVAAGMDSDVLCRWVHKLATAGLDWYEERDKAGKHGTLLHELAEFHLPMPFCHEWPEVKGKPDEQVAKLKATYDAIRAWWLKEQPAAVAAEEALVSESLQFGGTFDAVVQFPEGSVYPGLWLLDYKTGSQVGVKECAQMSAYRLLLHEVKGMRIAGAILIHAPTKHPGTIRPVRLDAAALDLGEKVFLSALDLTRLVREIKAVME